MASVHSNGIDEVHDVPMSVITRPISPVLDEDKVKSLMETISVGESQRAVYIKQKTVLSRWLEAHNITRLTKPFQRPINSSSIPVEAHRSN